MYRSLLGAQLLTFGVFMFSIFYNFWKFKKNQKKYAFTFFDVFKFRKNKQNIQKKLGMSITTSEVVPAELGRQPFVCTRGMVDS